MSTSNACTFHVVKVASKNAADSLSREFADWAASDEWEGEPLAVAEGDEHVVRYAYDIPGDDITSRIGKLATTHRLQIAVHIDWSQETEQGSVAGAVEWFDGCTGKHGSYTAEVNGFRPVFVLDDLKSIMAIGAETVAEAMDAAGSAVPNWVLGLFGGAVK